MDLIAELISRQINYNEIKETCYFNLVDKREVDVSIIIPVNGRTQFNHVICDHFKKAIEASDKNISLTIVEHSGSPSHKDLCYDWVNYIHIPRSKKNFNKCKCFNIGALYSNKAKYFLFHDVDTIMQNNFFKLLFDNYKNVDALQCFTKQRLLYCEEVLTNEIINGKISVDSLSNAGLRAGVCGATGGSIFISNEAFFNIGGYDAEFYSEYSVEDTAFFEKLQFYGKIGSCDNPTIELFHLKHDGTYIVKDEDRDALSAFRNLDAIGKQTYISVKSKLLKLFKNENN